MRLVYVTDPKAGHHRPGGIDLGVVELGAHDALEEALHVWNDLGQPECWVFDDPGKAPWHCPGTVQVPRQRGKVKA